MSYTDFWKQVVNLALPVALQMALVSALGMADVLMVAHLGESAIAAVGLSTKITFVLFVTMGALATGVSVLVAQYFGAHQNDKVKSTLAMGLIAGVTIMIPVSLLLAFTAPWLVAAGTQSEEVRQLGYVYLLWVSASLLPTLGIMLYEAAMRSVGQTHKPLVLSSVAIGINIVLNYWFINGGLGVHALGVAGAAIATLAARVVHFALIFQASRKIQSLTVTVSTFKQLRHTNVPGKFIHQTAPLILNFSLWAIGSLGYYLIIGQLGTMPLAVLSLIAPIESLYHSLFFGLVNACAIMIGQRLGRSAFGEAEWLAKRFMWIGPLGSFCLGLFLLGLSPWIISLMEVQNQETAHNLQWAMAVMCLGFWVKVFNLTVIQGILRAGGDSRYPFKIDMIGMWFVGLPVTWLAAFYWELPFIWVYAAVMTEEIVKAIGFYRRARKKVWLNSLADSTSESTKQASPA